MKKLFLLLFTIASLGIFSSASAQDYQGPKVLNVGLISGFNSYNFGVQADYEIAQLGQDFTVGVSAAFQSWDNNEYKGSSFAVGARFRWYADRVLNISHPKWDVFANGDIGFNINAPNGLWWGIGIGGKFHISESFGLQAIIGSGAQIGVTFQF